jgi:hypothetical protein
MCCVNGTPHKYELKHNMMLHSNIPLHRILGALHKKSKIISIICTTLLAILPLNGYYCNLLAQNLDGIKREASCFHTKLIQIHYIQRSLMFTGPNYAYLYVVAA